MALEVVTQLLTLSQDPEYRPFIVRDQGCLPGLVMFLENNDSEVVLKTLQTLANLSEHPDNHDAMAREPGLVTGLKGKLTSAQSTFAELAATTITNISAHIQRAAEPETPVKSYSSVSSDSYRTPLKQHNEVLEQVGLSVFSEKVAMKISAAKTHTFYIKGMNNFTKQKVEETLVGVKGVVSFLIDVHTHKAVVRTMTSADDLIVALKTAGLIATHGAEENDDKENEPGSPQYLPEAAAQQAAAQGRKGWGWGSIVSFGDNDKKNRYLFNTKARHYSPHLVVLLPSF